MRNTLTPSGSTHTGILNPTQSSKTQEEIKALLDRAMARNITYQEFTEHRATIMKYCHEDDFVGILKNIFWMKKHKIPRDDFIKYEQLRNNFRCHFLGDIYGKFHNSQPWYVNFVKNHPELANQLLGGYDPNHKFPSLAKRETPELLELLYQAYEIMFDDPTVENNHNLVG